MSALAARDVEAKAAYKSLEDTVASAETIAIVHTVRAAPAVLEGEHWVYAQRVTARVVETIKGPAAKGIQIAANKNFICAPARLDAPADYLVFLTPDRGHLATANHEWGALEIHDGNVEWPYGDETRERPLTEVVAEVRMMIDDPALQEDLQTYAEREMAKEAEVVEEPCAAPIAAEPSVEPPPDPEPATWRAPLTMASGAFAVLLGMLVATRRRRCFRAP